MSMPLRESNECSFHHFYQTFIIFISSHSQYYPKIHRSFLILLYFTILNQSHHVPSHSLLCYVWYEKTEWNGMKLHAIILIIE